MCIYYTEKNDLTIEFIYLLLRPATIYKWITIKQVLDFGIGGADAILGTVVYKIILS